MDSLERPYLCSNDMTVLNQSAKYGSYIEALTNCSNQNSKIASVSEVKNFWKSADSNEVGMNDSYSQSDMNKACRNSFWTSTKLLNNTHLISDKEIQEINFDEVDNSEIEMKRIPVASFETLKFESSTTDVHLCICVLYEAREVQNLSQSLTLSI